MVVVAYILYKHIWSDFNNYIYIYRYVYIYIYIYVYICIISHINNELTPSRNNMFNLITQYNPMLPHIKTNFKKYFPVLHSNKEMLRRFPANTINVTYKRNKNLKELIYPSLLPKIIKENSCSIEKCSRRCDICKNFLVVSTELLVMLVNVSTKKKAL